MVTYKGRIVCVEEAVMKELNLTHGQEVNLDLLQTILEVQSRRIIQIADPGPSEQVH